MPEGDFTIILIRSLSISNPTNKLGTKTREDENVYLNNPLMGKKYRIQKLNYETLKARRNVRYFLYFFLNCYIIKSKRI